LILSFVLITSVVAASVAIILVSEDYWTVFCKRIASEWPLPVCDFPRIDKEFVSMTFACGSQVISRPFWLRDV
jgi:hypothetical protein